MTAILRTNLEGPEHAADVPAACELSRGEIALNVTTGRMYTLTDTDPPAVQELFAHGTGDVRGGLYVGWAPLTISDITLSNGTVSESTPSGAFIGELASVSAGDVSGATYSLVAGSGDTDNHSFDIAGDRLLTHAAFEYSTQSTYSILVRSTVGEATHDKAFTITITEVPSQSISDILLSNSTVSNAATATFPVGELSAVRVNPVLGDAVVYALTAGTGSTDNSQFRVSGHTLLTSPTWAPASQTSFSVRVTATAGAASHETIFAITADAVPPPTLLDADYLVVTYEFLDGSDLDTRTSVNVADQIGSTVGWGRGSSMIYPSGGGYTWGGDNTGTGFESVLIDVAGIRAGYPGLPICGTCRAFWYVSRASGNVTVAITAYKGGTMSLVGYSYTNTGGRRTGVVARSSNVAALHGAQSAPGEYITDFSFSAENILSWGWDGCSGLPGAPSLPPAGLAVSQDVRDVVVSWSAVAGATSYSLQREVRSAASLNLPSQPAPTWTTEPLGDVTTQTYHSLPVGDVPSNPYRLTFRVAATVGGVQTDYCEARSIWTHTLPAAPSNLLATALPGAVRLNYSLLGSAEPYTGATARYRTAGGGWTPFAENAGPNFSQTTVTGLTPGVPYTFQVYASNAIGDSDWGPESAPASPT